MRSTLADTRDVLERIPRDRRVIVMVSGGKDSLATLDVCVRHFGAENVSGALMYLVRGLDCEWQHARRLEKRFGIKVHGVPHWTLSHLLKESTYRPYLPGSSTIRALKQPDIEAYIRKTLDGDWIAWGNRAADSVVRNAYLKRIRGVDVKFRRFYPIWTWKKRDVYPYLLGRKLPVPRIVGGRQAMGGVALTAEFLEWCETHYPQDIPKILAEFPFAWALVERARMERARNEKTA